MAPKKRWKRSSSMPAVRTPCTMAAISGLPASRGSASAAKNRSSKARNPAAVAATSPWVAPGASTMSSARRARA